MLCRIKRILKSDRGEANYISTVVYIFVAVVILAFIINLFSIISTKQQLDHCADQMVKQIQLSGGVDSDTEALFHYLSGEIQGATDIHYTIDSDYHSPRPSGMDKAIQLGTPFFITITGKASLGGFWDLEVSRITIVARGAGVSERYWK